MEWSFDPSGRRGPTNLGHPDLWQRAVGGVGGGHGGGVGLVEAGFGEGGLAGADGLFVAVEVGEVLDELDAAAMAVHVAEAANVHEDVEFEALAGGEGAGEFVVAAAMFGAEGDEFGDAGGGQCGDGALELAPGVVALGVEERGGEFDFERAGVFDEIDDGGGLDGLVGHQFGGGGAEFGAGGDGVVVGRGVLDQRGRGLDLADEGVGEAAGSLRGQVRPGWRTRRLLRAGRGPRRA